MPDEGLRDRLDKIYGLLKDERQSWEAHWRDLERYILPRRGRFLAQDRNKGKKKHHDILDSTATTAARALSAGMMSGITNPARPWIDLTTADPDLAEFGPHKQWLHDVTRRILRFFARTNIYRALPQSYLDEGVFGTSCIGAERDPVRGLSFTSIPIGQYYFATDHFGRAVVAYRQFAMTTRQLVEQFGEESVSKRVLEQWRKSQTEVWHDVMHAVTPNKDHSPERFGPEFKRFLSCYYELQGDKSQKLSVSGFDEFPYLCSRWSVTGEDVYGSGPGMDALGPIRELQHQRKQYSQAVEKMNNPPMVGHPSLRGRPASLIPGQITFVEPFRDGRPGFSPAYQVNFDTRGVRETIVDLRQEIDHVFFKDLFLMLASTDRRDMTATEIAERHEEKLSMLGPVLHQLDDDKFEPLVDLAISELHRRDELPPIPPDLEGKDLRIEFISILHQAQKLVGVSAVDRWVGHVTGVSQFHPEVLDTVNWDEDSSTYADMLGVPPNLVRSREERDAIRQARAQAAEAQRQMEMAAQGAKAARDLGSADVGDGQTALSRLVQQ
jgi:hypothetical protein